MISVIIPTLNEEKYLSDCLDSIKHQDINEKVEIIVVDAYSKDRTAEIAKRSNAKVLKQKPQGPAKAKNLGARNARGEIFIFTDGDTVFPPGAFRKIKKHYISKDVVAVGGPLLPAKKGLKHRFMYFLTTDLAPTICAALKFYQFQGSNTSLRADTFREMHGFDEDLLILEDNEIANRAKKYGKVVWDRSIKVLNDPRRFEQEGYLHRMLTSPKHNFDVYVRGKRKLDFKYTPRR